MDSIEMLGIIDEFSNKLHDMKFTSDNELNFHVASDLFKKIDEDLYYRQHLEEEKYIPSDDVITIQFKNLTLNIIKKNDTN